MAPSLIHDRASFRASLEEARTTTVRLLEQAQPADAAVVEHVAQQLARMQLQTEGTNVPDEQDAAAIDVGPLSFDRARRDNAGWPQDYTSSLQQLDYAFRRFAALAGPFRSGIEDVTRRRGILQLRYGRGVFQKRSLEPGERLIVGGDDRADFVLAGDKSLAGRQLEVWWDGVVAHVRTLTDDFFSLDGQRKLRGELHNGGSLVVGRFTLRFFVEAFSPAREPSVPATELASVRQQLLIPWSAGRLFALIDTARSRRALQLLEESIDEHASLYEGDRARGLDDVAPYLVRLAPRSGLLDRLLHEGWGHAWGIYLASASAPKMVRRSLRRLLMVDADTHPDPLYFRFYDPRVLRRFVPIVTPRQQSEMLAEAETLFYENEDTSLAQLDRPEPAVDETERA